MFNYLLYRLGQFIAFSLPLKKAYCAALFFSDLHYLFAAQDKKVVTENLKAIFPRESDSRIKQIRIQTFRNFAKYLVDFFRFSKLDKEYIRNNIRIENKDYLDQALSKGKGVILLSAHIGNWELGAAAVALSGYPLWVVALPHKEKRVDDFFNSQRESKGIKVMPLGRAARGCLKAFKENSMVALVGDRDFTEKGIRMDFFGRPAIFPEGPAVFALKTGAAIVPVFMLRNEDDTFTLELGKPLYFSPSQDREKDLQEVTRCCKNIIEDYIRRYPEQWYMFRRFWTL